MMIFDNGNDDDNNNDNDNDNDKEDNDDDKENDNDNDDDRSCRSSIPPLGSGSAVNRRPPARRRVGRVQQ